MEKPTKEQVEKWIKQQDWLLIDEKPTPTGRQLTYLTPSGQDVVIVYDVQGNLFGIGHVVQIPTPMPGFPVPGIIGHR